MPVYLTVAVGGIGPSNRVLHTVPVLGTDPFHQSRGVIHWGLGQITCQQCIHGWNTCTFAEGIIRSGGRVHAVATSSGVAKVPRGMIAPSRADAGTAGGKCMPFVVKNDRTPSRTRVCRVPCGYRGVLRRQRNGIKTRSRAHPRA